MPSPPVEYDDGEFYTGKGEKSAICEVARCSISTPKIAFEPNWAMTTWGSLAPGPRCDNSGKGGYFLFRARGSTYTWMEYRYPRLITLTINAVAGFRGKVWVTVNLKDGTYTKNGPYVFLPGRISLTTRVGSGEAWSGSTLPEEWLWGAIHREDYVDYWIEPCSYGAPIKPSEAQRLTGVNGEEFWRRVYRNDVYGVIIEALSFGTEAILHTPGIMSKNEFGTGSTRIFVFHGDLVQNTLEPAIELKKDSQSFPNRVFGDFAPFEDCENTVSVGTRINTKYNFVSKYYDMCLGSENNALFAIWKNDAGNPDAADDFEKNPENFGFFFDVVGFGSTVIRESPPKIALITSEEKNSPGFDIDAVNPILYPHINDQVIAVRMFSETEIRIWAVEKVPEDDETDGVEKLRCYVLDTSKVAALEIYSFNVLGLPVKLLYDIKYPKPDIDSLYLRGYFPQFDEKTGEEIEIPPDNRSYVLYKFSVSEDPMVFMDSSNVFSTRSVVSLIPDSWKEGQ